MSMQHMANAWLANPNAINYCVWYCGATLSNAEAELGVHAIAVTKVSLSLGRFRAVTELPLSLSSVVARCGRWHLTTG